MNCDRRVADGGASGQDVTLFGFRLPVAGVEYRSPQDQSALVQKDTQAFLPLLCTCHSDNFMVPPYLEDTSVRLHEASLIDGASPLPAINPPSLTPRFSIRIISE